MKVVGDPVTIQKIIDPLKIGRSLKNPSFWKKVQSICNVLSAVVPVLLLIIPWMPKWITVDFFISLSAALGAISLYLTNATSTKVGI